MSFIILRFAVLSACLAGACVAQGQRFSVGIKGGVELTDPSPFSGGGESKRYLAGLSVEYRIWEGLAVESDFLYRFRGFSTAFNYQTPGLPVGNDQFYTATQGRLRSHIFDIPVLGKYYFMRDSAVQPYVLTGYTFRKPYSQERNETTVSTPDGTRIQTSRNDYWRPLEIGATVGLGLRWRSGRVAFLPEFRYTRWGYQPSTPTRRDQVDFLLGINF